jgi:hypothetical protein
MKKQKKNTRKIKKKNAEGGNEFDNNQDKFTIVNPPVYGYLKPRVVSSLVYSDVVTVIVATTVVGTYVYRMNSLFKPDKNNAGHQPYGFPELAAIYNRYRVFRFAYEIRVPNTSGDLILSTAMFNGVTPTINTAATFNVLTEYPRSVTKTTGGGANEVVFRNRVNLNKVTGCSFNQYSSDDRFQALFNANPTEIFELCFGYYNPTIASVTLQILFKLTYTAELFDIFTQNA